MSLLLWLRLVSDIAQFVFVAATQHAADGFSGKAPAHQKAGLPRPLGRLGRRTAVAIFALPDLLGPRQFVFDGGQCSIDQFGADAYGAQLLGKPRVSQRALRAFKRIST